MSRMYVCVAAADACSMHVCTEYVSRHINAAFPSFCFVSLFSLLSVCLSMCVSVPPVPHLVRPASRQWPDKMQPNPGTVGRRSFRYMAISGASLGILRLANRSIRPGIV